MSLSFIFFGLSKVDVKIQAAKLAYSVLLNENIFIHMQFLDSSGYGELTAEIKFKFVFTKDVELK